MSVLPELLAEVERAGGRLVPDGDGLKIRAARPIADDLLARLRAHKPDLVQLLGDPPIPMPLVLPDGRHWWRLPAGSKEADPPDMGALLSQARAAGAVLVADGRTLIVGGKRQQMPNALLTDLARHAGPVVDALHVASDQRLRGP